MMYGTVDSVDDRIEHLRVLRELQDETGGFTAFACWSYQPGGCSARGDDHLGLTAADYLLMNAVARLYLDNIAHMQSSWVTQGLRIGMLAELHPRLSHSDICQLLIAAEQAGRGGSGTVLLTRVGGGAFGNDLGWIDDAIDRALERTAGAGLDVRLVRRY